MRKLSVLLIFIFAFAGAQNQRFTYEYKFVPDSTNRTDVHRELMTLDVYSKGSRFYSYEKFKSDSLNKADLEKQMSLKSQSITINQTYKGKIFYTVSKDYPSFKTYLHARVGSDSYKVLDDRKAVWTISPEKLKIGDLETQKAETKMYGRTWTAWFAAEIPIQDGPYKFSGLPGLIVKLEDATGSHSFELKGIRTNGLDQSKTGEATEIKKKELEVSYSTYKKLYLEQLKDPTKALRLMLSQSSDSFKMFDSSGKELSQTEMIRKREENAKENRRKNNNGIELDLMK